METLAAFCRALRVTLVGSMIPDLHEILELAGGRVVAHVAFELGDLFADHAAVDAGVVGDLGQRSAAARRMML